jgi:hypothetical protein
LDDEESLSHVSFSHFRCSDHNGDGDCGGDGDDDGDIDIGCVDCGTSGLKAEP